MAWVKSTHWNIHEASACGVLDVVEKFLDAGIDVNELRKEWTPLVMAASSGKLDVIELLIDRGAEIDRRCGPIGTTALMAAAMEGQEKACRLLIDNGASVHVRNHAGKAALSMAAWSGCSSNAILDLLIAHGAMIDEQDNKGMTPLMYACVAGVPSRVSHLLALGARIDIEDKEGHRAFHHALMNATPHEEGLRGRSKKMLLSSFIDHGEDPVGRMPMPDGRSYPDFLLSRTIAPENKECAAMLRSMAARRVVESAIASVSRGADLSAALR
jgi:hypothetical protein